MIEWTHDYRRLTRLATFEPILISSKALYLVENKDGEDMGFWSFHKYKDGLMVHADMGEKCRGKNAIESLRNAFKWVFDHVGVEAIYAEVPKEFKPSAIVAINAGMGYTHSENSNRFFKVTKCQV